MNNRVNLLFGGLSLLALQGCKAPQVEQAGHPNIIYVFPDQYRNQAMEFWNQDGFREKVNFKGDPKDIGKIIKVKITEAKTWALKGESIES